ncbi:Na+/H+ antiporter subunit C [Taylorella equigenitalis]|uniref:Na(+) H(+) antiporter subunit C n=1 Tax=Taylorella equigenitalis (strain MCE9) TaxID=937774 RepID=A0A654KIP8_TAYEM|nr:Na+/H+ antiporter subunit C [Taylorella equigenitalis]ADU92348.1 Na(+) H(+) antiporter subunit C [Taylorella equigenitalis MCE9]WDU55640.1 Na+/H+ antiporter subunit C [Taylorella equigenitalis]
MELIYSIAVGVLAGSGVWLLLRQRTFQILIGISLLSYAINLFIFGTGRLVVGKAPLLQKSSDSLVYADPVPQSLVLTAIVIGFALTALILIMILAQRGLTGSDHVDGQGD